MMWGHQEFKVGFPSVRGLEKKPGENGRAIERFFNCLGNQSPLRRSSTQGRERREDLQKTNRKEPIIQSGISKIACSPLMKGQAPNLRERGSRNW